MKQALPAERKRDPRLLVILLSALSVAMAPAAAPAQETNPQEIPGPLSAVHVPKHGETECAACHEGPGKVAAAKCLACHTEIASRIAAQKGYHRDKADDCALCHAEHQGRQADLVPLERSSFDHAETGVELRGAHLRPKDCDACHTPSNSYPRTKGRSYLLKVPGCRGCHPAPHPGRQDKCLDCHTEVSWTVDRQAARG
jgi:hypothetical protein